MRKLLGASLKILYRDRQSLFWALAFPVIFAVVFGLFNFNEGPTINMDLVAPARSPVSQALTAGLSKVGSFKVKNVTSLAAARQDLTGGKVDVVLQVPAGAGLPGSSTVVGLLYNQSNLTTNQVALDSVGKIVDGMNLRLAGIASPAVVLRPRGVVGKSVHYYDFLLPGLVAMGVMNFSIIGMAVALARFREQRILRRILATPLRPVKFLGAQVLARLVLALVQAALILATGVVLFHAHLYGNVLWIFVLAAVANLIFLNFGFAVAGRANNPDAAQGVANFISLPMMFLSGVFFSTDMLPKVLQRVVQWLPLTPLIEAMRKVANEGLSITHAGPQLALLGGWVAVSFALAARNFRFEQA